MYSPTVERALRVAELAHRKDTRKGGETPYFLHPVHAALIAARAGADEDTLVATLLHDVVEDCPDWSAERLQSEFGPRVSSIVAEVTENKSLTWEERKQAAIDHVPHLSPEALMVKAADKLHNLSSLLEDLRAADDPAQVWSAFTRGPEQTLAISQALVSALAPRLDEPLASALQSVLGELESL